MGVRRTGTTGLGGAAAPLAAAALLLPLLAGCCGLTRASDSPVGNRDTPEAAFAYIREAFRSDLTGDQYDSFHNDFREANGLSRAKYGLARSLRPGLFEDAAALLGRAEIEAVTPGAGLHPTSGGPLPWAEVVLALPGGGRGTFVLVDEPVLLVVTDDGGLGLPSPIVHRTMDREIRIEDGRLVIALDRRLPVPPADGSRVRRIEIHHDWLLYGIRSVEGLDRLLEQVRSTAEEAGAEETGGEGEGEHP